MDKNTLAQYSQTIILTGISLFFIILCPKLWYFTPDSGMYIGTAKSILETGAYNFNGYPNLQYYPGISLLLCIPVVLFGYNFYPIQLFFLVISLSSLWLMKNLFSADRYGKIAVLVPIIVACSSIFQNYSFRILSDGIFLTVSLCCLLLWRRYSEEDSKTSFIVCLLLVSFASLIRFQGLFLCLAFMAAFSVKTFFHSKHNDENFLKIIKIFSLGILIILPFALWTLRNYLEHTPDTFNMANARFFGLKGLQLYASGYGKVDWIQHEWIYGLYHLAYSIVNVNASIIGRKLINYFPLVLICIVNVSLVVAGGKKWLKNASLMEMLYVSFSLTFLFKEILFAKHLYIVERYWLPMLPFLALAFVAGLNAVHKRLKPGVLQTASMAVLIVFTATVCFNGTDNLFKIKKSHAYYSNADKVFPEIKAFMARENIDRKNIAVTDWGVVPFILDQKSIQVLNDKDHLQTLKRMTLYKTKYLIIFTGLAAFHESALKMVEELPQFFNLIYEKSFDAGPDVLIFKVDIDSVQEFLESMDYKKDL